MRDAGRLASAVGVDGYDFFAYFIPGMTLTSALLISSLYQYSSIAAHYWLLLSDDAWLKGMLVISALLAYILTCYAVGHITASIGVFIDTHLGSSTKARLFSKSASKKPCDTSWVWVKVKPFDKAFRKRLAELYLQRFGMFFSSHEKDQAHVIWMMHNYNHAYGRNPDWYHKFIYKMLVLYGFCSNMGTSLLLSCGMTLLIIDVWEWRYVVISVVVWYALLYRSRHLYYNYYLRTMVVTFVVGADECDAAGRT